MGTTCQLSYRVDGGHERETVWVVNPAHPIAQGIGEGFIIPTEEVYREFHDVPQPEELVLISGFPGGEDRNHLRVIHVAGSQSKTPRGNGCRLLAS